MRATFKPKVVSSALAAVLVAFTAIAASAVTSTPTITISSLSPSSCVAGSGAFTLTVDGTGFISSSKVVFGFLPVTTTFVSATEITAAVPADAVLAPGQIPVFVSNGRTAGFSKPAAFTVTPSSPPPAITSLSPDTCVAGGASFVLTVDGSGFISKSTVIFGGIRTTTTFVSATEVMASIPADAIAAPRNVFVTVTNGISSGFAKPVAFAITPSSPAPTITSISPTSVKAGSQGITLTVDGTNFTSTSVVDFFGAPLTTTFVSATELTAAVPTDALRFPHEVPVAVNNGISSGRSKSVVFTITRNTTLPRITSLSPNSVIAGSADFVLTINGINFDSTSTATFGATALSTTFVSSTQLTASVPATLVATAGVFPITVTNSSGTSEKARFAVLPTTSANLVYLLGKSGSDALNLQFTFTPSTAPDFTQPVTLDLATVTTPAVQVLDEANLTLTSTPITIGASTVDLEVYKSATLFLVIAPLPDGQYNLLANASGLNLGSVDTTSKVDISLSVGTDTFTDTVTPFVLKN